jgi:hypothetical protein
MRAFSRHPMQDDQRLAPWGLLLAGLLALALAAALTSPARAGTSQPNSPQVGQLMLPGSLPLTVA